MTSQPRAYRIRVDWDGDGLYANAHSDVTGRLVAMPQALRGRNYGDQIYGRSEAGICKVVLRNDDGLYDRFDPSSALADKVVPGRLVEFATRKSGIGQDFAAQWTGYLDDVRPIEAGSGRNRVSLIALGPLAQIVDRDASVAVQTSITVADAWPLLLNSLGVPASERGTLAGNREMDYWYVRDQKGIRAARELEETEIGFLHETKDGLIAHDAENHRETGGRRTSAFTINRDGASSSEIAPRTLRPSDPLKDIANVVTVPIRNFETAAQATLWTLPYVPQLAAGETKIFLAEYPNPDSARNIIGVSEWTDLAANTDYRGNDASDGSGTNRTGSLTVTFTKATTSLRIEVENGHTGAVYLTRLQARGTPLREGARSSVEVRDQASIDSPGIGRRDYAVPAQWISDLDDAESYGGFLVSLLKDPQTRAWVSFPATLYEDEAQTVDLSTRITLQRHGESEEFFVEAIDHRLDRGGQHVVDLLLSPAGVYGQTIVLGTGPGLGTGRLAR